MNQSKKEELPEQHISRFRTELMGFCIFWIYLFHAPVEFPNNTLFLPIVLFKDIGYAGVDFFFFLSGFGLMAGMTKKKSDTLTFYKKRLRRILPAYWIATIATFICEGILGRDVPLSEMLLKLTTLWFWVGYGRFLWFIPSILLLYFIFPAFYQAHVRSKRKRLFIFLCIALSIILTQSVPSNYNYLVVFLSRIPIFLLGAHIAYEVARDTIPTFSLKWYTAGAVVVLAASILLSRLCPHDFLKTTGLLWYRFSLMTFPATVTLACAFKKLADIKRAGVPNITLPLYFLGTLSLEIYLVHEHLVFILGPRLWESIAYDKPVLQFLNVGKILEYSIFFGISVIGAWILRACANIAFRGPGLAKRIRSTP